MSTRTAIPEHEGIYFITFTCINWLSLFELSNGYAAVYKWFDYLIGKGHFLLGYVIMPNHVHLLIAFRNSGQSLNKVVGNGKRFMAYDIIQRLKEAGNDQLLVQLSSYVSVAERKKGKLHEVFEPSFDWKECLSHNFIEQKLNYIHENPCKGKWQLASKLEEYEHSSANYYITGEQGVYPVTSYMELEDVDLTQRSL